MFLSKLDKVVIKNLHDMVYTMYGKSVRDGSIKPLVRTLSVDTGFTTLGVNSNEGVADRVYYGYFNGSIKMKTLYDIFTVCCNAKNVVYQPSQVNTGYAGPVWKPFCTKPILFNYASLTVADGGTIESFFEFVGVEINL